MAIDRTERLLNLVFCLMSARRAVSRADIQRTISGYGADQSAAAFERMFERDKDELRAMGVPVDTVVDVNGEVEGYRIPLDEYALAPLEFDAQEAAVLTLAAQVWDDAVLKSDAVTALRKLEAAAGSGTAPEERAKDFADRTFVRHSASDSAILSLMAAVRASRIVTFEYRTASGATAMRTVDPWGVVARSGSWYLVGRDHDRDAMRAFRVSRITGDVSVTRTPASSGKPNDVDLAAAIEFDHGPGVTVLVAIKGGFGAELRRLAHSTLDPTADVVLTISDVGERRLIDALCAAGAGAQVIEPTAIRSAVLERLSAVAQAHR